MSRPPKEYRAFATLTDRLLAVPRETLQKRLAEHREAHTNRREARTQVEGYHLRRRSRICLK